MNTKLRTLAVVVAFTMVVVCFVPLFGQVIRGSISGSVIDPQGAVVAGAQVKARNMETGIVTTTTSDNSGLFRLNLLPVGTYTVEVSSQGFKTSSQANVLVTAGKDSGIGPMKMAIGETSTTLEVSAAAPLIETTQSQVTNTFSGTTLTSFAGIQENEGLDRLALFVPGVASSRSDNFSNTNGASISSNGLRGRNNDQEIDGQNNNDNSVGGPGLFVSDTEFVGQYVIITNQFGPEYGRNSGSVVNIITKSGTNAWHGSVFGNERSSYTEALSNSQHNTNKQGTNTGLPGTITCPPNNPTCNPLSGPPRFNEEFSGGTIGGPMMKNKMFLFGGLDNDLFSGSNFFTTTSRTPTPAGLAKLGGCGVDPKALSILQKFGPYGFGFGNPSPRNTSFTTVGSCVAANANDPNGVQVGGVTRLAPIPFHGFDFVVKHDLQLGSDTITSRYLFNRGNTFNRTDSGTAAAAAGWFDNVPALSQAILESWTHNFSARMVNEARVSFGRLNVEFGGGINPLLTDAGHLDQAFTNIAITGFLGLGPATNIPQSRLVNTWQGQDNWNYVSGKHNFKSGVNWTYQRSPNIFLPIVNGAYRYSNLNAFLTGAAPNRVQIAQGNSNLDFREYDTFAYFGDDWKLKSNLTLNLGLTWTYYGQPANLFHDITTARESTSNALWLQSLDPSIRTNPAIPAVTNSYGPSVGFAYSPQWGGFLTGNGKTVIRGGYRLLYDPPFYNIFVNISSSAPMTFLNTLTSGLTASMLPAVPTGPNVRNQLAAAIQTNTFDPRTQNETNVSNNFGPDRVHSWSLGFEREITKNSAFEARYVGNHGENLFQTVDSNPYLGTATQTAITSKNVVGGPGLLQLFPQFLPSGTPTAACAATTQSGPLANVGTDVGRVSCGTGVSRTRNNGGFSDYNGMQLEFRANNMFKQLTMRTGYTWAKTLDNVSEIFATGTAGNTVFAAQNPFQTGGAERSTSGLDFTHIWSILFTEQIPFFQQQHGILGHVLGGWSISADYLLGSGQPYTPIQGLFEATNSTWRSACNTGATTNCFGNFYDTAFVNGFLGADAAHPFLGNTNAPINTVGIYAFDFCLGALGVAPAANNNLPVACNTNLTNPNSLISYNAMNGNGGIATSGAALSVAQGGTPAVIVTANDVRYIINGHVAQTVFGTPFGNVPRNSSRDAISNIMNASIYKDMKLGEHSSFQLRLTANNALNHFNFTSIDPNLEDAGVARFGSDFANPAVTTASGRTIWIGGTLRF